MPTARRTAYSEWRGKTGAPRTFAELFSGLFFFFDNPKSPTTPSATSYDSHSVGSSFARRHRWLGSAPAGRPAVAGKPTDMPMRSGRDPRFFRGSMPNLHSFPTLRTLLA